MSKRAIPPLLKQGSQTPEEIREAVRRVMAERDAAVWKKVAWSADPEEPLAEAEHPSSTQQTAPPLTGAQPGVKILPMKSRKRVLLEPATISPKRALIQAAVER